MYVCEKYEQDEEEKRVMKEAELASEVEQNTISVYFSIRAKHNALG